MKPMGSWGCQILEWGGVSLPSLSKQMSISN